MAIVFFIGLILVIYYQRKLDQEKSMDPHQMTLEGCLQDALTAYSAEQVENKVLSKVADAYRMPKDWLDRVLRLSSASDEGKKFLLQTQQELGFIPAKSAYQWAMKEYAQNEDTKRLTSVV